MREALYLRRSVLLSATVALSLIAAPAMATLESGQVNGTITGFFFSGTFPLPPGVVSFNSEFLLGESIVVDFTYDTALLADTDLDPSHSNHNNALTDVSITFSDSGFGWMFGSTLGTGVGSMGLFNDVVSGDKLTDQWGLTSVDTSVLGTSFDGFTPDFLEVGAVQFVVASLGVLPDLSTNGDAPLSGQITNFDHKGGDFRVFFSHENGDSGQLGILFSPIPEPSTALLLGLGLVAMALRRKE